MNYIFKSWKESCQCKWTNRGILIQRFFINLKKLTNYRLLYSKSKAIGLSKYISKIKKRYFKKWFRYITMKQNIKYQPRYQFNYYYHQNLYKLLKTSFFLFFQKVLLWKRLRTKYQLAVIYNNRQKSKIYLSFWLKYTKTKLTIQYAKKQSLLSTYFLQWKTIYIPTNKLKKLKNQKYLLLLNIYQNKSTQKIFQNWYFLYKKSKKCHKLTGFLLEKHQFKLKKSVFNKWVIKYNNNMYWKMKEMELECQRLTMVYDLEMKHRMDIENEFKLVSVVIYISSEILCRNI